MRLSIIISAVAFFSLAMIHSAEAACFYEASSYNYNDRTYYDGDAGGRLNYRINRTSPEQPTGTDCNVLYGSPHSFGYNYYYDNNNNYSRTYANNGYTRTLEPVGTIKTAAPSVKYVRTTAPDAQVETNPTNSYSFTRTNNTYKREATTYVYRRTYN